MDYIFDEKSDYYIREVTNLPYAIHGATMDDEDGNHNIYINARLPEDKKQKALQHEIGHNRYGHLNDDIKTVEEKENEIKKP